MKINPKILVSPWNVALFISLSGLISVFIPPKFYSYYVGETDYMYRDWNMMLYVLICTTIFCISAYLSYKASSRLKPVVSPSGIILYSSLNISSIILITSSFLLTTYQLYVINSQLGITQILNSLLSGGGGQARQAVSEAISGGRVGWISIYSSIIVVWFVFLNIHNRRMASRLFLVTSLIIFIISTSISLSRDTLISTSVMALVVIFGLSSSFGRVNLSRLIIVSIFVGGSFLAIFVGFDIVRSGGNFKLENTVTQILGYFPASYNRLSAILDNHLKYPNSHWGYYSSQFLWDTPVINTIAQIILDIPDKALPSTSYQNWLDQFLYVRYSGLNPTYIWATVFGFAFEDYGYGAFFFFLIYGMFSGFIYSLFRKRELISIVLYPMVVSTIVKWWSIISISQRSVLICIIFGIILYLIGFLVATATRRRVVSILKLKAI